MKLPVIDNLNNGRMKKQHLYASLAQNSFESGIYPAAGCLSGPNGNYDADTEVFSTLTARDLARTRSVSTLCRDNVDAYVQGLVNANRFRYVSLLTAAIRGPVNGLPLPTVLQYWGQGVLRKV